VAALVDFSRQSISDFHAPAPHGWMVTNPPYGVRVGDQHALRDLYSRFGAVLRECCRDWRVAVLSAAPQLERALHLDLRPALHTTNGGIPVKLLVGNIA
jgi:putative N6-adenine-specific DNA methylase